MKILLLEPFYATSHRQWVDGLIAHSRHEVKLMPMDGRHWKWRMGQSAVHFAQEISKSKLKHDLILCNDLTNVAVLRGLLQAIGNKDSWYNQVPIYVYFHENQITYPWSADDQDVKLNRDVHYGWINYLSCLSADKVIFNSFFHQSDFLSSLPAFLDQFPDDTPLHKVEKIRAKSHVLPIGLDLDHLYTLKKQEHQAPTILWNHRWEYDKNPESFFQALFTLAEEDLAFSVVIAGEKYKRYPEIFDIAKEKLRDRIIHFGYAKSRQEYVNLLQTSDIIPVTSNQDFFGISAIEAIAAGCYPLLPDRLAFTEHLQVSNKADYYYSTGEQLVKKLRNLISSKAYYQSDARIHVLKYDWQKLINQYDDLFEEALRS